MIPSCSRDTLLGDFDMHGCAKEGYLDMGTADVLRTDTAVRRGMGPDGASSVGGVLSSKEAGEDRSAGEGDLNL